MAKTIIDMTLIGLVQDGSQLTIGTMISRTDTFKEAKQALLKALLDAKPEKKPITYGNSYDNGKADGFNTGADAYEANIKALFKEGE